MLPAAAAQLPAAPSPGSAAPHPLHELPRMLSTFEQLGPQMKNYMLFQLLRRCAHPSLQFLNGIIAPTLKRDFLRLLPFELCQQVLQNLDARSLARCAIVSKGWRAVVEGRGAEITVWKRRLVERGWLHDDEVSLYRRHHIIQQNWNKGRCERTSFPGHGSHVVTCLQFDADKIVSGSDDQSIHIYSTKGHLLQRLTGHDGGVWALQYWRHILVSGSTDRSVRVWDMDRGVNTHTFEGHTSTVRCLMILIPRPHCETGVLEPPEPLIVTGSRDTTLRVWRLPDPHTDPGWDAAAHAGEDRVNPWFKHVLAGHEQSVRAIAGKGRILVSGSYDHTVRIWDVMEGRVNWVCSGHTQKVYSVGYCEETARAVSGSMDMSVRVWCTKTGTALFNLEGHSNLVGLLELSPHYLVTAAADWTLRIWNPMNGQCLARLKGHTAAITCFHHDPALNRIVSGSEGGVKDARVLAGADGAPVYGRPIGDIVSNAVGVWRVRMDEERLVCAVQKELEQTFFEVLDF
ncbi:hypothetical protein CXG81DRAFT_14826, partial [Caulochytrium protostelioides]